MKENREVSRLANLGAHTEFVLRRTFVPHTNTAHGAIRSAVADKHEKKV